VEVCASRSIQRKIVIRRPRLVVDEEIIVIDIDKDFIMVSMIGTVDAHKGFMKEDGWPLPVFLLFYSKLALPYSRESKYLSTAR